MEGQHAAAVILQRHAKDMIGEELPAWPALADATVEEKQALGFTGRVSATDPLLRTGELRASIKAEVDGKRVVLGSDDPIAVYQEEGTRSMPPRPFIGATMFSLGHEMADLIANYELGAAMGGRGPLVPVQPRDGG